MRKLLWRGFLGLICIVVLYVALNIKPQQEVVARDFIEALVSNDDQRAVELMSPTLQSSYGATNSISASLLGNSSDIERVVWNGRTDTDLHNNRHKGVIHFSDGSQKYFRLTVNQQKNESVTVSSVSIQ